MCELATEAVFAGAVVVVELDECLRSVGVGTWEIEGCEFADFVVALGFELAQKVESFFL